MDMTRMTAGRGLFRRRRGLTYVCVLWVAATRPAGAEAPPARETPIMTPGRSVAANDQSSSIVTNPAILGFLVSTEARWMWVSTGDGSPVPGRGHAFDLA